ncbi:MAG: hypothetical protein K2J62_03745 [Bacteroidales bacterium]|nr:hypothetical protein [Bacteroidales bacterium]
MRNKMYIAIILASAIICSCSVDDCIPYRVEDGRCILNVEIDTECNPGSRSAGTGTETQAYESAVNDIQIFIYDSFGQIEAYCRTGGSTGLVQVSTTSGPKTVWAVINGPDMSMSTQAATAEGISRTCTILDDNSIADGFVMAGCAECTISESGESVSVPVRRFVSRIVLKRISSMLPPGYGPLIIKNVFLANVAGSQEISGSASTEIWYNQAGRTESATDASMIIGMDGNQASCPELTFKDAGYEIPYGDSFYPGTPLYCYPNHSSSDTAGWTMPYTGRKTRLIVSAEISGIDCYYPVTIDFPERNTAYTVEITITGPGSTDPDIPVARGNASVAISLQDWRSGAEYSETI